MWPTRSDRWNEIRQALRSHSERIRDLPGIMQEDSCDTLAMQIIASLRREDYYRRVQQKLILAAKADPNSSVFDPERAVAYHLQRGDIEEAAWLIFLMTHFARPASTGWLRLRQVYGKLGQGIWDWVTVSSAPDQMIEWLSENWTNVGGRFGNHRKYESLRPDADRPFGTVLRSYVEWIGESGHQSHFSSVVQKTGNDPKTIFDALYREMRVVGFGRLAKFDYLAMIARYGIAPIEAGSAYLDGATGPAFGARLLFTGSGKGVATNRQLQIWLEELDGSLNVGMAVMEDALCNWQKSPSSFVHYKG